jgi:hypothetical protein
MHKDVALAQFGSAAHVAVAVMAAFVGPQVGSEMVSKEPPATHP